MTSLWSYDNCTPYDVLGVSPSAGVSEIRQSFRKMALRTHPDKSMGQWDHSMTNNQGLHDQAGTVASFGIPFYLVKEAVEVLLDPFLRHQYDQLHCQTMLRSVGASSETCSLSENFVLVSSLEGSSFGGGWADIYQRECRCGGTYEITQLRSGSAQTAEMLQATRSNLRRKTTYCECDTCSLVVEVILDECEQNTADPN
ncbi:unnamed protein product [Phytomonas sp. EM1]|nr:unnamed protein product [Phytomonas sp. EM1]|eukprot:CCW64918.1 unnamed protein product [Phytomonas sp. isolate EM1]